jgi:triosephosphate isomerase
MRKKLVVGNWKMNMSQPEAVTLAQALVSGLSQVDKVDVGICPTFLCISKLSEVFRNSSIFLGAQDCFWVPKGAFTGQISAQMLADCGVTACIVGHSETRGRFGKLEIDEQAVPLFAESNFSVNLKIKGLLPLGLTPILCVGETFAEKQSGLTDETVKAQLVEGLEGIESEEFFEGVVAYEPVWAIGTGEVCETTEASRVCGFIRQTLSEIFGPERAESTRILYGGSVKSGNARALFHAADIDGGLVGGASLIADEFQRIVLSAA